jgi:hypothetical protein
MGILALVLVIWGGYELFELWDKYDTERDVKEKEAASHQFSPQQLSGMPYELETSYGNAQKNGAKGVRNWLRAYVNKIKDPRRAWIELDYVVLVAHEDPNEAKKVFADVKARSVTSPDVQKRIKELEKTYD